MFKACSLLHLFFLTGSYTQTSNEGYEDFLKKLNVGFILRKAAMASTPVMTIAEVEDPCFSHSISICCVMDKKYNIAPKNPKLTQSAKILTGQEGGNWTMITKTTVKSIELRFR